MNQPKEIQDILNNKTMTKAEKEKAINVYYDGLKKSYQKEHDDYFIKQRLGAALEIGSAAIPMGGAGRIGAKVGENLLKKQLGRKISKNIGSGVLSGAGSGGMFGAGDGLMQDKIPLPTAIGGAAAGAAAGGAIGAAGTNIERAVNAEKLRNYGDIDQLPANLRKEYNKFARKFFQDYLQEQQVDLDGVTDISKKAVQEQLRWNPQQAQNYPDLIKDLKKAKRLPDEPNLKPDQKPYVSHYEVYQGEKGIHYVEVSNKGEKRYYITRGVPESESRSTNPRALRDNNNIYLDGNIVNPQVDKSAGKRLMNDAPLSNITSENGTRSISELTADETRLPQAISRTPDIANTTNEMTPSQNSSESFSNIIQQNGEFVNPAEVGASASIPLLTPILDGRVEMNVDENGEPIDLSQADGQKHIFTAEEIGRMSIDDFRKNEEEIMRQYGLGMIIPRGKERINYSDYTNPIIPEMNRIFTREDIHSMLPEQYKIYENSIRAQAEKIGLPTDWEMKGASMRGDGVVYVRPYTRSDGTKVKGYWRSIN